MNIKKVLKTGAIAAVAGLSLVGCAQEPVFETKIEYVDVPVEVVKEVEIEKIVEVEVESAEAIAFKEYVEEAEGDLTELYDETSRDVDIADVIVFDLDMRALALAEVEAELFDELDREVTGGVTLDEDEMEDLEIDSDFDEVIRTDLDFSREEATYNITGEFKHDNDDYEFEVEVELEDYEVEDFTIVSVTKQ